MANLKIYNRNTGQWEEIKIDSRINFIKNHVVLPARLNSVDVGVTNFNPADDGLLVFKNEKYAVENKDYIFNAGTLKIYNIDGSDWDVGTEFVFIVFKNVQREIPSADGSLIQDGSLTEAKFAEGIKISPALIDSDGQTYQDLKERLLGIDNKIIENKQEIDTIKENLGFDFTLVSPIYHTTLNLADSTVMQCFVIDEQTGEFYASQVASDSPSGNESFIISRLNANGVLLDSMKLVNGGHGTAFGLERDNGIVYIWSAYNSINAPEGIDEYDLVRFPYTASAVFDANSEEIVRFNHFTDGLYTIPIIDQKNDLIALCKKNGSSRVIELRKFSEFKNNYNNLLASYTIPSDLSYLQGMTIDGYDLYWYTGDVNSVTYPNELTLIDLKTGTIKKRITCDFGRNANGEYEENFREPEGIYLYTDPLTDKKSLFAGVVTGANGKRINKIYAYHQLGNEGKFTGELMQGLQRYALTKNDGSAIRISNSTISLSEITKPGNYYVDTPETLQLSDHPDPGNAGWWLDVSPYDKSGSIRQTLTRNSTVRSIKKYERVITYDGDIGDWGVIPILGYGEPILSNVTKISQITVPGHYYMTTEEAQNLTDHPSHDDAGWWLDVSTIGADGSVKQRLSRNSINRPIKIYERVVNKNGSVGEWMEIIASPLVSWTDIPLKNGATHEDPAYKLQYSINSRLLLIRGYVNIPDTDGIIFATLSPEATPSTTWFVNCPVAGTTGIRKISVGSDGNLTAYGCIANDPSKITYTYVDIIVPLN